METMNKCEPCVSRQTESISVIRCIECQENLCLSCSEHHKAYKAFRNHHLVNLELRPTLERDDSNYRCTKHPKMDIEFFCVKHDEMLCCECLARNHKTCPDTMSVESAAKNIKQSKTFSGFCQTMESVSRTYKDVIDSTEQNIVYLIEQESAIRQTIRNQKDKIIAELNTKEELLNKKLNEILTKATTDLQNEKDQLLQYQQQVRMYESELSLLIDRGLEKQVFIFLKQVEPKLQTLESDITKLNSLQQVINFENTEPPVIPELGAIKSDRVSRKDITHTPPKAREPRATANQDIVSFELVEEIPMLGKTVTSMTVTDTNLLLLCNHWDKNVLVFNDKNKQVNTILLSIRPLDIAIIPDTKNVVVSSEKTEIIFVSFESMKQVKQVLVMNAINIFGIAATKDTILIGDKEGKIHFTNLEGNYIRSMKVSSRTIRFINVGNNGTIFCLDRDKVVCVEPNGKEMFRYSIPEERNHRSIISDKLGRIYVGGFYTNSVHRLHPDGTLDRIVLNKVKQCYNLLAICLNKKCDKLYVSNHEKSITMYRCKQDIEL